MLKLGVIMEGILIVNKPKGVTSHQIVSKLRKILNIKQIGHIGTLDPNATGVLPILIGKATKTSKYLIEHDKEYIATLKLGRQTDTGDIEGKVIKEGPVPTLNKDELENVLKSFLGEQNQIPPIYSSVKINGKKAYEYARNGETVELKPRKINIYSIQLLTYSSDKIVYKVNCSKGTYIRKLCEDIALKLGTVGFMDDLVRTKVDNFIIEDAITLDLNENQIRNKIISIEKVFDNNGEIEIKDVEKLLNGVNIQTDKPDGVYKLYYNQKFLGLGIVQNNGLKRDIII